MTEKRKSAHCLRNGHFLSWLELSTPFTGTMPRAEYRQWEQTKLDWLGKPSPHLFETRFVLLAPALKRCAGGPKAEGKYRAVYMPLAMRDGFARFVRVLWTPLEDIDREIFFHEKSARFLTKKSVLKYEFFLVRPGLNALVFAHRLAHPGEISVNPCHPPRNSFRSL